VLAYPAWRETVETGGPQLFVNPAGFVNSDITLPVFFGIFFFVFEFFEGRASILGVGRLFR